MNNAEPSSRVTLEQVVDWRAAVLAGLVAGVVFFILQMVGRALVTGGSVWLAPHYIAAIVLGTEILPPPAPFDPLVVLIAILLNTILSLIFTLILAAIIHEWQLITGVIVGALFGLALYAINYYSLSYFFPWFYPIRTWVDVTAHVLFGAIAGGVYEYLEVERFVMERGN
ncbi:MAG TPA: hypothetical protein VK879_14785 [Candidatus Sulfomarinibacteraceae bacterium]|nr:hypothetical protein [Candidatus Sulfomarinibacteraceae bacterium]